MQFNLEDLCQELSKNQCRKAGYVLLARPSDKNPDPRYKPYFHLKSYHDRLLVIELEAGQDSLFLYQRANGSVLCYGTVPSEVLIKIINMEDRSDRFRKEEIKEEEQ